MVNLLKSVCCRNLLKHPLCNWRRQNHWYGTTKVYTLPSYHAASFA